MLLSVTADHLQVGRHAAESGINLRRFVFDFSFTSRQSGSLRTSIGASLVEWLRGSLRTSMGASLVEWLRGSLRTSVGASLVEWLNGSLRPSMGASLVEWLSGSLRTSMGASLVEWLSGSLRTSMGASLVEWLRGSLRTSMGASLVEWLSADRLLGLLGGCGLSTWVIWLWCLGDLALNNQVIKSVLRLTYDTSVIICYAEWRRFSFSFVLCVCVCICLSVCLSVHAKIWEIEKLLMRHWHNGAKQWRAVPTATFQMLVVALVHSWLDYGSAVGAQRSGTTHLPSATVRPHLGCVGNTVLAARPRTCAVQNYGAIFQSASQQRATISETSCRHHRPTWSASSAVSKYQRPSCAVHQAVHCWQPCFSGCHTQVWNGLPGCHLIDIIADFSPSIKN